MVRAILHPDQRSQCGGRFRADFLAISFYNTVFSQLSCDSTARRIGTCIGLLVLHLHLCHHATVTYVRKPARLCGGCPSSPKAPNRSRGHTITFPATNTLSIILQIKCPTEDNSSRTTKMSSVLKNPEETHIFAILYPAEGKLQRVRQKYHERLSSYRFPFSQVNSSRN